MEATELRIGNLVNHKFITRDENLFTVGNINGHGLMLLEDHPDIYKVQPILLTEEWLVRLGFKIESYIATGEYYVRGTKYLERIGGYLYNVIVSAAYPEEWDLKISTNPTLNKKDQKEITLSLVRFKYVHQLQNLYFTLTGKELELIENS